MKVTLDLPKELFDHLRLTSIHRGEDMGDVIKHIIKLYYGDRS